MGTRIAGVYIPDKGEKNWLGANELNDGLELLARRTQNLPTDGTHGDAAHGPDYAKQSELSTFGAQDARNAVEGNSDAADLTGESGTNGQVLQSDGTNASWTDAAQDTNTQAYSLAASGSVTLSNGKGAVDTGVAADNGIYDVAVNPGGADIAVSLDGSGTTYVIHAEENSTQVGNPTVNYQLVRSEL